MRITAMSTPHGAINTDGQCVCSYSNPLARIQDAVRQVVLPHGAPNTGGNTGSNITGAVHIRQPATPGADNTAAVASIFYAWRSLSGA